MKIAIPPVLLVFLLLVLPAHAELQWIWKTATPRTESADFKKAFSLPAVPASARLQITCDNSFILYVNGKEAARSPDWFAPVKTDIARYLRQGDNELLVKAENEGSMAGLLVKLEIATADQKLTIESDAGWLAADGGSSDWHPAVAVSKYGAAPWGDVLNVPAPGRRTPSTMPITALPGFKVEEVFVGDKKTQGSWVGLTVDPKGRFIACDQHGGLYRVTLGKTVGESKAERLNVKVHGAQGVLCAFGSLYVFVAHAENGVYRLRDTNGDDQYDQEEFIVPVDANGEHGTHSIVLGPDGQSLYLIAGNNANIPKTVTRSRLANAWDEDLLLPRMPDGRGHNRGCLAPGGFIMKMDPDGKNQELIAHGFRNEYDAAFNAAGDLFTYDADMEWDIGAPWYRPTRVNHVVSGADYGWRNGSGKWPEYYPDTLPATLNIGLGSPTGVTNGIGAKFPARYQQAIFICDWTYGTMYAIHLEAAGSTYQASKEEFVAGKPLPFTDVVIHPDGNMYFIVGGRDTQTSIYRVSYVGTESTAPVPAAAVNAANQHRRNLEKLHADGVGPEAIAQAWPDLADGDRLIRYAARVAIEKQPAEKWLDKLYAETRPWAVIEGAVALAHVGNSRELSKLLPCLNSLDLASADNDQLLAVIRAYQLAFIRMGRPEAAAANAVIAKLSPLYPHLDNFVNRELCQVLLYLNAPGAVSTSVRLMLSSAETQAKLLDDQVLMRNDSYRDAADKMAQTRPNSQQFAFAFALRSIKEGWSDADRASYFSWFPRAKTWQGGNSYAIFVENSRLEALANVPDGEMRRKLDALSSKSLATSKEIIPPTGPGRNWTVAAARQAVENNLHNRNFKSGENLFAAVACASCHRFAGEGSGIGPDITGAVNRYTLADLLENIIEPSKVISDLYGSEQFTMNDGSMIVGRIGGDQAGVIQLMTNPFSSDITVEIKRADVKERKPWPISAMPPMLINSLNADELSDLIAYILAVGDPRNPYFAATAPAPPVGGETIFNGRDLSGWKGDPALWSVQNGEIVGSTFAKKLTTGSFLIWDGEVENFELVFEARVEGNNSGMTYRSVLGDEKNLTLFGYQEDIHPKTEYLGMLYCDGRGVVVQRGQKAIVDAAGGAARVIGRTCEITPVDIAQWQHYEVIADGNHLIHKVNGVVTMDVIDNHPARAAKGLLGMQLHPGAPMKCYYRNIVLKKLP